MNTHLGQLRYSQMDKIPLPSEGELKYFALLLGIIVSAIGVWKQTRLSQRLVKIWQKTLGRSNHKMNLILRELQPNGGSSLRDQVCRIEREIQAARIDQLVDFMSRKEALFQTDAEGNCIGANRAYLRLVDPTFGEIEGRGWVSMFPQDERERVMSEWDLAVQEKRDFDMEVPIRQQDGGILNAHAHAFRKVDYEGNLVGYMGRLETV